MAVPHRLEDRVRKAEGHDVLDGLFPEVVVDSEDGVFVEYALHDVVQLARRLEIAAERLLDHDPVVAGAGVETGSLQLLRYRFIRRRRRRAVENSVAADMARAVELVELSREFPEIVDFAEVDRHVEEHV